MRPLSKTLTTPSRSAPTLSEVLRSIRTLEVDDGDRQLRFNLELVERMAAQGMTTRQIGAFFGVSANELRQRKALADELADAVERGKTIGIKAVSEQLLEQAKEGNTIAAIFYLKTVAKWREADRLPPDDEREGGVKIYLPERAKDTDD